MKCLNCQFENREGATFCGKCGEGLFLLCPHLLSFIHHDSGDMAAAQNAAKEALELSIKGSSGRGEGCSRIILGRISGKIKSHENNEAEDQILHGIKILEELELKPYVSQGYFYLGELYGDAGQNDKALEWLTKAESKFQRIGMDYDLSLSKSIIGKVLSEISPSKFPQSEQIILKCDENRSGNRIQTCFSNGPSLSRRNMRR